MKRATAIIAASYTVSVGPTVDIEAVTFPLVAKKVVDLTLSGGVGAALNAVGADLGEEQVLDADRRKLKGLPPGAMEVYRP